MPKMKSNSGAKKRYDLTGTGKVKRKHAYKSHILTKKSNKRKRNLGYSTLVSSTESKRAKILAGA
jgi:large subunit ribosomal protein L35